jgi:hypothetical protein
LRYSSDRVFRAAALALTLAITVSLGGCSPKSPPEEERAPLTERERDSTLGASGLPGATAVTKALAVSDTAAARAGAALPETP